LAANAATLMGTGTTRVLDYITYEYEDSHGVTHQRTLEIVVVRDAAGKWTSPDDIDGETHQTYVAFTGADQSASSDTDGVGPIAGNDTVRIDYNLTNSSVNLKSGNDDLTLKGTLTSSAASSISKIDAGDGNDLLTIIGNIKGFAAANKANTVVDLGAGDDTLNITSSGTTAAVQFATLLGGAGNDSLRISTGAAMTDATLDGGTGTDIVRLESSVLKLATMGSQSFLKGGTDAVGDLIDRPAGDGTTHQIGDMLSLDRNLSVDSLGTAASSSGTGTFAFGGITTTNTTQFEALHLDYTGGTSMDLIDIANVLRDFDTKNFEGVIKSLIFTGDSNDRFVLPAGFTKVSENIQLNGFTEPFACYKGMVNGQETFIYLETGPNAPVTIEADDRFVMYTGSTAANINSKAITGDVKHNDAAYDHMVSTGTVNTLYGKATFNADGTITYVLAATAATLMGTGTTPVKDYITYEYEDQHGVTHTKTVEVVVVRDAAGKWTSPDDIDGETHQTYVAFTGADQSASSDTDGLGPIAGNDTVRIDYNLTNSSVNLKSGDDDMTLKGTLTSSAAASISKIDAGDGNDLLNIIGNIKGYAAANKGNTVVDLGAGDDALNITSSGTTAAVQFATLLGGAGNDSIRINSAAAMTGAAISGGDDNDTIEYTGSLAAASTTVNSITGDAGNDSIRINTGVAMAYTTIDGGTGTDIVRLESSILKLAAMGTGAALKGGTDAAGDLIDRPAGDGTTHQIGDMLSLDRNLSVDSNGTAAISGGTGTFAFGGITTANTTQFEALHLDYTGGTGMDLIDITNVLRDFDTKNFEGVIKSLIFTGDTNDKFVLPAGFTKVSENIQLNGFTEPFACYKGLVNGQETFIYLETGPNAPVILDAPDDRFVMYTGNTAANINGKVITGDVKHNDADFVRMLNVGGTLTGLYGTATINADGTLTYTLAANAATLMGAGTTPVKDYITYEYEDSHGVTHQRTVEVVVVRDAAGKWDSPDDVDGETHQTYVNIDSGSNASVTQGAGAGNDTMTGNYQLKNANVEFGAGDDVVVVNSSASANTIDNSSINLGEGNNSYIQTLKAAGWYYGLIDSSITSGGGDDYLSFTSESGGIMTNGNISTGAGNDTVELNLFVPVTLRQTTAIHCGNKIDLGAGDDSFSVNVYGASPGAIGNIAMYGAYNDAIIDGGSGNDTILISSNNYAIYARDVYTAGNYTYGGVGNDQIIIKGDMYGETGRGKNIISAGADDDLISITGNITGTGSGSNTISGDAGNDLIRINTGVAMTYTTIDGGTGKDIVRLEGKTLNLNVMSTGAAVKGGVGDDAISRPAGSGTTHQLGDIISLDRNLAAGTTNLFGGITSTNTTQFEGLHLDYTGSTDSINFATLLTSLGTNGFTGTKKFQSLVFTGDAGDNIIGGTGWTRVGGNGSFVKLEGFGDTEFACYSIAGGTYAGSYIYVQKGMLVSGIAPMSMLLEETDSMGADLAAAAAGMIGMENMENAGEHFAFQQALTTNMAGTTGNDTYSVDVHEPVAMGTIAGADLALHAAAGHDNIAVTAHGEYAYGMYAATGSYTIAGEGGDDTILIQAEGENAYGMYATGTGTNVIDGGAGNDTIHLEGGQHALFAEGNGSNQIFGGAGSDTVILSGKITGDAAHNIIDGGLGDLDMLHITLDDADPADMVTLNGLTTNATVTNFEAILLDMEGDESNMLNMTQSMLDSLLEMGWQDAGNRGAGSDAAVFVKGDADDTLSLKEAGVTWNQGGTVTEDGRIYDHWQDNKGHDLFVEQEIKLITS
uniref:beta strand repeat-containing protein n=1 Tax=Desulfovibrio cuneatus TaxID=159728 RepID=UPI000485487D